MAHNFNKMHAALRQRLLARFNTPDVPKQSILLLQGTKQGARDNTDIETLLRQESNFHYLFGVNEGGFYATLHVDEGKSVLFMPRLPPAYAVWMGKIPSCDEVREKYGVEEVHYVDELKDYINKASPSVIYTLRGKNTDSGEIMTPAYYEGMDEHRVDHGRLWDELCECRVIKTKEEIEVMRHVNHISSQAHLDVMKAAKPGMYEYELESLFHHRAYSGGGCRYFAYTPICASGPNGAILHYGHAGAPNDRQLQDGDMLLLDMGAEYHCYSSDLTRSYPCNGKFTPKQRDVYETVMEAKQACFAIIKAGINWEQVHRTADRTIVEGLLKRGYLKGDVDEMVKAHVGGLFMPHGVGHLIGVDTHDIGGYPKGMERINESNLKSLRTRRDLAPGMVLTVEPGCYFIESLLLPAFEDKKYKDFLVVDKLRDMLGFGGVRLEDNIAVTEDGYDNLSFGPTTVAEIEEIMGCRPGAEKKRKIDE